METTTTPADRIKATAERLDLTLAYEFVPFSRSRNKREKNPSLNYIAALAVKGQEIIRTDYMMGSGHCRSREVKFTSGKADHYATRNVIKAECETGIPHFSASTSGGTILPCSVRKKTLPDSVDVIACLVRDADVLDYGRFEDWAESMGYDTDSRSAEATYRKCLEHALALRNAVGDEGFKALQEACQDY